MKYTPLAFAAAALTASSAPTATTASADGNIQLAAHRYYWGHGGDWGHHHHHGGSGVWLGLGLPLFGGPYYDDYYDSYDYGYYAPRAYYAPAGGSHVRWCMNRYRTYDPRSNTFIGYDGERHRCVSPYRY